ncbi:MAG TPA: aspartate-semialdehyde dehydrogenase [Clostridiales bacterium]|jgi:aspartate-semialdehyde dehydrogenase|nr:aspartate-semialdehyde dehydrogenase [Clostridiales bacterium]
MYAIPKKLKVGVIGATGMVGQRFLSLLADHPYFDVIKLAASARSAGKSYETALDGRWKLSEQMPAQFKDMIVENAADVADFSKDIDFVFCAVDMKADETVALETAYAKAECPVVSNNKACRWMADVPMMIPELNPEHMDVIPLQRKRLGTNYGFVAAKPNCSIQSYVPMLTPLLKYRPTKVAVTTYQAISGAGKTFAEWPEMIDNVIPYIGGEEEKSEMEPLKIWGKLTDGGIITAKEPIISAQCIRVPVTDGHMAAVFVSFEEKPAAEQIISEWKNFEGEPQRLGLPNAPEQFITYFDEPDRPQTKLDRDIYRGMGITAGRLRPDTIFDYKFIGISHNTLRGAAGGAVETAELLAAKGWLRSKS